MAEVQCQVCDKTKQRQYAILCPECRECVCQVCYEKSLTSEFGIKCLVCNVVFPESEWSTTFTAVLVPKVRKRAGEDLFAASEARRGCLQAKAARELHVREILTNVPVLNVERKRLQGVIKAAKGALAQVHKEEGILFQLAHDLESDNSPGEEASTRGCLTAGCRGRLDVTGHCSLCKSTVCADCDEAAHAGPCDAGRVATAVLLRATTKPCPRCSGRIGKIPGGCDQMFCPRDKCHCFFSWTTGKELAASAPRHNPHYFDVLRQGKFVEATKTAWDEQSELLLKKIWLIKNMTGAGYKQSAVLHRLVGTVNQLLEYTQTDIERATTECRACEEKVLVNYTLGESWDHTTGATKRVDRDSCTKALINIQTTRVYWERYGAVVAEFIQAVQKVWAGAYQSVTVTTGQELLAVLFDPCERLVTAFKTTTEQLKGRGLVTKPANGIESDTWLIRRN